VTTLTETQMIDAITKAVPEARPVPYGDFDGTDATGIWFKGSEDHAANGLPIYDTYEEFGGEMIHKALSKVLEAGGTNENI